MMSIMMMMVVMVIIDNIVVVVGALTISYVHVFGSGKLACRFVIEKLELMVSDVKKKEIKGRRTEVWKDAFQDAGTFARMRKIYGDNISVAAAAEVVTTMYQILSTETHHPEFDAVPIRLGLLNENEARVMVQFCEMYPVKYQVYNIDGSPADNAAYGGVAY